MKTDDTSRARTARRYGFLLLSWSLLVSGSLVWNMHQETRNTLGAATAAANANIDKDFAFRKWATSHGGVYVPPTEHTPPNPYLNLPDRDVVTSKGKELTLMNPAYILRELQTDFADEYGIMGHITSLKLLNPKNAPDAWEAEALRAFEKGEKERVDVQQIEGRIYLRVMRPMITEKGCLKCHGFQGYKVGEIRGGVSTSVYLEPYLARERDLKTTLALTHGAIWLMGLAGLGFSYRRDRHLAIRQEQAERELRESEQKYHLVADYTADWEYWIGLKGEIVYMSPSCQAVTGHGVDEFVADPYLLITLVHPDDRTEFQAHSHAHNEQAAEGKIEFRIVRNDGETRWISHHCRPVYDRQGNWRGSRASNRDITAKKRLEEELREAGVYNRSLIEASLDPLVTISAEGKITDVNRATEKITGRSRAELVGTDFSDYFTEPDKARAGYRQVFAQGFVTDYPLALRHRDGHVADVLYNASIYRDEAGEVLGVFAAARDITERKLADEQLRRSEHSLSEAQRIAHLGNWELDLVHNVLLWSDEIYRIFEIDPDKFGASYEAFLNAIHPDDRDMVNKAYTDSLASRVPYNIVHRLKMPDGRIKYVNEMCETYYDDNGKPLRSIGTVHDITERKLAEEEIKALNRDLEQRVIERTAQLEAANKELEAFSYSVSHDLRTPLRAIDGFSHILLEDYNDKLDDEGKRLLNVVRDNTGKMGQLIEDILKFSRAGRLELVPVEIDMEKMAHEVFDELHPVVDANKLQLEIGPLPHASGDRAMMRQVFVNLLSNAIKFSREREPAVIKVGASVEGGEAVYYVTDNGAGFDMQFAAKLFGVFQRLHGVTEFEGTGIGLAIVKRIVARHGGRVWAEGKPNEGATIYFALPTREADHG
jgi:PAS domain S-box-containing protein